jgi:hypothetical protein
VSEPAKTTLQCSPTQFTAAQAVATGHGLTLTPHCVLTFDGVTLQVDWDGTGLTLQVLKKPFIVSAQYIFGKVQDWLEGTNVAS